MATFCRSCGSPISGRFCTKCGTAMQETVAPTQRDAPLNGPTSQNAPMAPVAGKSSGARILLFLLGGLFLVGAMGVGTVVYVGYRAKQKITELKQEYGMENGGANGAHSSTRRFPPSQGSGCRMLEGQEAAQILGVAVARAEFEPNGPDGTQMCRYWVSVAERQRMVREEMASGLLGMGKAADTNGGQANIENLIGGAAGALNEVNGGNKDSEYAFSLQVWQKNGKEQWEKMELVQTRTKNAMGAGVTGVAMQSVQSVGDRAIELPAGHSIMVLKGDTFFLLGFQQFVPGAEKTAALARIVAGRI